MKKILVIDESPLFRDYLTKKLTEKNFSVVQAMNGLDGSVKMRREVPDLIIMDYYITRKSILEVLQEKKENPNVSGSPVILVSSKIDKEKLVELRSFNVKRFFAKPLKIDVLLKSVAELLGEQIDLDETPCLVEAHFNDEILFIEIALGLNLEKIELLQYKITELLDLYQVHTPRILIMLSNLTLSASDAGKLRALLQAVLDYGGAQPKYIKLLTVDPFINEYVASHSEFAGIEVTSTLEKAMDDLLRLRPDAPADKQVQAARDKLLRGGSAPAPGREEAVDFRFAGERELLSGESLDRIAKDVLIGVVDDDEVIRELVKTVFSETTWKIKSYVNGKEFVGDVENNSFDLVFLDLMMPEMDGFGVLAHLKKKGIGVPIIILSALSQKETVVKAVSFGVTSYLIKPLKPERILMKATEALKMNF